MIQGHSVDYQDFTGITALLIINSTISFIEENNAGNAAAALMARLAPKAKVDFLHRLVFEKPLHFTFNFCICFHRFFSSLFLINRFYAMENGVRRMLQCWFRET